MPHSLKQAAPTLSGAKRASGRRDAILIVLTCAVVLTVAVHFDLSTALVRWASAQEQWGFDELLSMFLVSALGFMLFARRRRTELLREVVERRRAEEELRATKLQLDRLLDASPAVLYSTRVSGQEVTPVWVSPNILRAMGYTVEEALVPAWWPTHIHPDDRAALLARGTDFQKQAVREYRFQHKDGSYRWVRDVARPMPTEDSSVIELVGAWMDITERKRLEEQLAYQAFHDPLTGLANRALFRDRVMHALERAQRRQQPVTALFLDLDNFKAVNDSLGHAAGDQLLVAVAERLLHSTRGADSVARLGGDEFAILLEHARADQEARTVVERVTRALLRPFSLEGKEVFVGASIGIAGAANGDGPDELLRNADVAMYRAKAAGKGGYVLFEPAMHSAAVERLELEAEFHWALERGELMLHYQPVAALGTGQITGVEALVRWNHPRQGLIPPAAFIPLAEETGLIVPLGRWVLREACRQAARWQWGMPGEAPLTVSVNISGRHLQDAGLVEDVAAALRESGLTPASLTVEITESVLMQNTEATLVRLHELKALGVRLAIDDFGTGYSSLSYLQRFPVDILKIDKSFIDGVERGRNDDALARTIIALGQMLSLRTIAEGIEEGDQVRRLQDLGCELGQGYFFAKPLPAEELDALLGLPVSSSA